MMNWWYRIYINGYIDVDAEDMDDAEEIAAEGIDGLDYFHIDEVTLLEENTEEE